MGASASPSRHFIVGGYPASPSWAGDAAGLRRFSDQMLAWDGPSDHTMGLEVPYLATSPWTDPSVLLATPPESRHVLTMIPATMTELRSRPEYGLASVEGDGRRAAVEDVRGAIEFAREINAGSGGKVIALEVQSAPRAPHASPDAFRRSIEELADHDRGEVQLWIEHCDARDEDFEKGFLPLIDELVVAVDRGVGVLINWGRSAIELRSAERVTEHVGAAAEAGVLRGLIFSGVASEPTEYGHAWVDAHLPVRGSLGSDSSVVDTSLLTREHVDRALRVAGGPDLVGIKMGMPRETADDARLTMLRANVELIAEAVDAAGGHAERSQP